MAFASEIEAFTPPQFARENQSPMSPIVMSPLTPRGHQHTFSSASANGTAEVTTLQPVTIRQSRGPRLSFLGGRKKEQQSLSPSAHMNGAGRQNSISEVSEEPSPKAQDSRRTSFFRSISLENQSLSPQPKVSHNVSVRASNGTHVPNGLLSASNTDASDWVTDSGGGSRGSYDKHMIAGIPADSMDKERESSGGVGTPKMGGVKKRLSMLKLGARKTRTNGTMGALNEE